MTYAYTPAADNRVQGYYPDYSRAIAGDDDDNNDAEDIGADF